MSDAVRYLVPGGIAAFAARDEPQRRLVLVLGMHRSGTSALAGALTAAGAWPGDPGDLMEPTEENERGYFERPATAAALDGLLLALGGSWQDPPLERLTPPVLQPYRPLLRGLIADLLVRAPADRTPLLKDPRLCLFASELSALLDSSVVLVLAVRHPLDVAASLQATRSIPLGVGLALWEAYNVSVCSGLGGRPVHVVRYDELLEDGRVLETLLPRCLGSGEELPPAALEAASGFLTPSLRHHRLPSGDEAAWLWPALARLWRRLEDAARERRPVSLPAASLSPVAEELLGLARSAHAADAEHKPGPQRPAADERSSPAAAADDGPTVARLETELVDMRRQLADASAERTSLEAELAAARSQADQLVAELAERGEELEQTRAERDRHATELAERQSVVERVQGERDRLAGELAEARAAAEDLRASLADRRAELERAAARAEALTRDLARARAGQQRLAAELERVDEEAADWRQRARIVLARARELERERHRALLERDSASRALALAERRSDRLAGEGARLRAQARELHRKLLRARRQLDARLDELVAARRELAALGTERAALERTLHELEVERADTQRELLLERDRSLGFVHSLRSVVGDFHPEADPAAFCEDELLGWARAIEHERERLREANDLLLAELAAVNRHREQLVAELSATRESESWKLGRVLTWPVRVGLRRDRKAPPLG